MRRSRRIRTWSEGEVSARKAIATLALATGVAVALSVGINAASAEQAEDPAPDMDVQWAERPATVADLSSESEAVVRATVLSVSAGPDDQLGDVSIPTERISLRIDEALAGSAPQTITLFSVGGEDARPSGAPAYSVGQEYILFVRRRDAGDDTWIAVAPDGRLHIEDGVATSVIDGAVADQVDGADEETVSELVDEGASE